MTVYQWCASSEEGQYGVRCMLYQAFRALKGLANNFSKCPDYLTVCLDV